jgi:hypothetical protein
LTKTTKIEILILAETSLSSPQLKFDQRPDSRGNFLSERVPNCTSETTKSKPILKITKILFGTRNDLAFAASDVQFANSLLKKWP